MTHREYVKQWRKNNPAAWGECKKRNYEKGAQNRDNAQQVWTIQDIEKISAPGRPCDRELARMLGRTVQAIQVQRCLLKKKASNVACVSVAESASP